MDGTLPCGHPSLWSGKNQVSPNGANVLAIAASSNTSLACSIELVSVLFPLQTVRSVFLSAPTCSFSS